MNARWLLISIFSIFQMTALALSPPVELSFSGRSDNDLYKVLQKEGFSPKRYDSPDKAIKAAKRNSAVFIIADEYPKGKTRVSKALLSLAKQKNLRVYIEYPEALPGLSIGDSVIKTTIERGIITSDAFGSELQPMSILGVNDCHVLPVSALNSPLIVLGKVAGFDKAVYGIDDVNTYSVLFEHDNMMVAMTKFSDFAKGRYSPSAHWKNVWEYILSWMTGNKNVQFKDWLSYVKPAYQKNETLPADAKKTSVRNGVNWFYDGNLFIHPSWKDLWLKYQGDGLNPNGPPLPEKYPTGDGSLGIIEGPTSQINYDGSQMVRYWIRADDQGEAAYALSAAASFLKDNSYNDAATKLIDYVFHHSNLVSGGKSDKNSPLYGLIGWSDTHPWVFYGDDNARCVLGMLGASAYMNTGQWDEEILKNILANFRTTGRNGFRTSRLEEKDILKNGWEYYWNRDNINPHPHFESWLWACYLWLYDKTKYEPLLERSKKAIKATMDAYPAQWKWTNGIQQERARMVLPLAWLVRVEDTPEHRAWLDKVVSDLLSFQVESGAIREELGAASTGRYGAPKSNKEYGSTEATLISENGDPVADMLYTSNFAFFSLNEAAHATGNQTYFKALKKLDEFLTRIQVKSDRYKGIDGAWFRAFDYDLWDYWASNADAGWGAWSTLTGWIQSWIVTTQVLVDNDQSYWKLTSSSRIGKHMDKVTGEMFGNNNR